jgi:hypothetical protein
MERTGGGGSSTVVKGNLTRKGQHTVMRNATIKEEEDSSGWTTPADKRNASNHSTLSREDDNQKSQKLHSSSD